MAADCNPQPFALVHENCVVGMIVGRCRLRMAESLSLYTNASCRVLFTTSCARGFAPKKQKPQNIFRKPLLRARGIARLAKSFWNVRFLPAETVSFAFRIEKRETARFRVCIFSKSMINYSIEGAGAILLLPCCLKTAIFQQARENPTKSMHVLAAAPREMRSAGLSFHIMPDAFMSAAVGSWTDLSRSVWERSPLSTNVFRHAGFRSES